MQTLIALFLSVALLLCGTASQKADPDLAAKTGSYLVRVLQAVGSFEKEAAAPIKNLATVKTPTSLYSSYSQGSLALLSLEKGDQLSVKRAAEFLSTPWVYVTAKGRGVSGWVLASNLNMPSVVEPADLDSSESGSDYVPQYARMGIVTASQLNIRTAPGVNFDRVGVYHSGDRVGIIETNSGWGRTARGWISLDYVYMDGQVGRNRMVGNVTATQLNIRSGPGTRYAIRSTCGQGDRLLILEQVYSGGSFWGCTRFGWVCMDYVQPDFIPGTVIPIYGYGVIRDNALSVYPSIGTGSAPVDTLQKGTVVAVLEAAKVDGVLWGHIPTGWIDMTHVDTRAIFEQTQVPPPPVMPEPPTEATEPSTEATQPSTEATEPSTEATEPSTEATEPSTEATEPSTEATQPSTEATEPSTEATQPSTEATEPSTEATQPSTEATQPSTEATEPSTEATQPSTEATQPSTEATQPSTEATKPSTEATEPSTEATKPSTEATEPSTEVTNKDKEEGAPVE